MTILCEPNGQTAAAMLPGLGPHAIAVPTLDEAALAFAAQPDEHLVIFGPELPIQPVVDFARQARASRPDVSVVVVRWAVDPATLEIAGAEGLEVVPADDPNLLADLATRAHGSVAEDVSQEEAPRGQIITVFAAKGGCGKTTLATNLAVTLSSSDSARVCLVDLDLDFGDVAISLQLTPTRTLVDATDPEFINRFADEHARLEGLAVSYAPGLDCVLAPAEPGEGDRVSAALVTTLLDDLRTGYDYIVVDTPSHFSEHVLAALDKTDYYVLVTTPEIPSLKNLRLTLDMFDLLGYERQKRLVVFNRSDDQTGLTATDIEATVKAPIAAHVPSSRDVPVSINKGVPLAQSQPRHPFSVAVRNFVAGAIRHQSTTTGGRLFSRRKPVRN